MTFHVGLGISNGRKTMVQPDEKQAAREQAKELRSQIYDLIDREREIQREAGQRVLDGQPADDLWTKRSELRARQEDLSCAASLLHAMAL